MYNLFNPKVQKLVRQFSDQQRDENDLTGRSKAPDLEVYQYVVTYFNPTL